MGEPDLQIQTAKWLVKLFEAREFPQDVEYFRSKIEELGGEGAR